ncbi:MAG: ABC transporter related protein [Candidatus Parvarchaeum acidophilus ARMAN-5_'5-way FS']|jgi:ATP-binding cassette subfamily E protein 1|uniref:ABC transporter related protein n=2 Tax=Parvarchaeum acidophilus TaxID=662761 RepID=F2UTZ6_PARA5|nr:MAG: ABC transporter related protein [Candidatus Parvarchaeum acidophilus ARMAN-5_'5-way FS']
MRVAVIKESECEAPDNCNYICAEVCPRVREGAKETVYARENGKAAITESLCISCGICVKRCPFDAIKIINLPDEMAKNLTFQYGINSFRTFNIATPIEKKIVGIIGRNGIGKTTNINIISNKIIPNFGNFDKVYSTEEVIKEFRGKDIQPYLTRLYSKELKIAKKEQNFSQTGKVKNIVKSNRFKLINQDLLDRDSESLSGGEAQLVEIAKVLDEEAEVYIFDEPMNYLDINTRFNVSKTIKEALKDKTVIVVEHDLVMLDYLTDFVQIFYGSEANYGVASHIMPSRNGINTYLEGYLPAENVRFRDYSIKIKKVLPATTNEPFISWPEFTIKINDFTLDTKGGRLFKGDVVGILGENGIGKSTFIKALAGLLETSIGKLDLGIKIAYKPQILKPFDSIVNETLININPRYTEDLGIISAINKLGINKIINKNVKNLSGGELQKLAVITTLMQNADIYLIDEPSANLDIEDRLECMNIISSFISSRNKCAIIVDHDLSFLDSTCPKSILFRGQKGVNGMTDDIESTEKAINNFLKNVDITIRRDKDSGRPRINQNGSKLDIEQKSAGIYFAE